MTLYTDFDIDTIPGIMRDAKWHVWNGKDKKPRVPGGGLAKPHQARPFKECVNFAKPRGWGIGIQMASTKFLIGIDLDGCGVPPEPWAQEIIERASSQVWISASGTGLRLVVHGLWKGRGREYAFEGSHHGFGVYPSGYTRFLTIGPPFRGKGVSMNQPFIDWLRDKYFPQEEVVQQSTAVKEIKKIATYYERCYPNDGVVGHLQESRCQFGKLWRGDWSKYASQSEADLALMNHLCFEYVGPNPERLETLFTVSGLGRRAKWIDRPDYRDWTVEKAIKGYLNSPVFVSDVVRIRR